VVEHTIGNGEVDSSILSSSTSFTVFINEMKKGDNFHARAIVVGNGTGS